MKQSLQLALAITLIAVVIGGVLYWWTTRPSNTTEVSNSENLIDVTLIPGESKRVRYEADKDLLVFSYVLRAGADCAQGCQLNHAEGTGREFELVTIEGKVQSHWLGGVPPGYPGVPGDLVPTVTLKPGQEASGEAYFVIEDIATDFILRYTGGKWKTEGPTTINLNPF